MLLCKKDFDMEQIKNQLEYSIEMLEALKEQFSGEDEGGNLLPDTYGCDYVFQAHFLTPEMGDDFFEVAANFLVKEFGKIPEYSKTEYYYGRLEIQNTEQLYNAHVLSFMVNAYRSGSEYAKGVLLSLYKKYYKKEYNQIKRFSTMSVNELMGFVESDFTLPRDVSRVLFFAELMGIRIQKEINWIYSLLNSIASEKEELFDDNASHNLEWKERLISYSDEAKEAINKSFPDRKEMYDLQEKWQKATDNALRFYDLFPSFLDISDDTYFDLEDSLENAYILLKKSFPKRDITKDELVLFGELMHAIGAAGCNKERLEYLLTEIPFSIENSPKKEILEKERETIDKTISTADADEIEKEELLSLISDLRRLNHEKESEIKQCRSELGESKKAIKELTSTKEQLSDARSELATLRSYVYQLTQEDIPKYTVTLDEMKCVLKEKKIVIVGGHSNWSSKIKNIFPDWILIKPSPSGALETSPVENADYVYFFTDIISHSTYARYINVLRTKKIPFGYLHGVNVDENIRYIYQQVEKER